MDKLVSNPRVVFHRNGDYGEDFYVVLFDSEEKEFKGEKFIAITFSSNSPEQGVVQRRGFTAILRISDILEYALNPKLDIRNLPAWRGDRFEPEILEAISKSR